MMKSIISAAGLVAAVSAFTQPTSQTYGSLLTPNTDSPVTTGQDYKITWTPKDPTDGVTVSLVLCNGPGSNCVLQSSAIVEKVPAAAGSYTWSVPCSLPEGTASTATGYGMLIIVDGTGEFQYSTQFSVKKGDTCSASSTTTTSSSGSSSKSSSGSSVSGKPTPYTTSSGWDSWTATFNTTTTPAYTPTPKYTTPAGVTSAPSSSYPQASSTAANTTAATPKPFTGAAAVPTAFINAAGLIGAAGFALFAL